MEFRVDPNGKVFTDHVRKETVPCILQTITHRIRGHIFKLPENRIKDDFNDATEGFIAVTQAEVLDLNDHAIAQAEFLMVNKDHVVWVLPAEPLPADSSNAEA